MQSVNLKILTKKETKIQIQFKKLTKSQIGLGFVSWTENYDLKNQNVFFDQDRVMRVLVKKVSLHTSRWFIQAVAKSSIIIRNSFG